MRDATKTKLRKCAQLYVDMYEQRWPGGSCATSIAEEMGCAVVTIVSFIKKPPFVEELQRLGFEGKVSLQNRDGKRKTAKKRSAAPAVAKPAPQEPAIQRKERPPTLAEQLRAKPRGVVTDSLLELRAVRAILASDEERSDGLTNWKHSNWN